MINVLMMKERKANTKLMEHRVQALAARDDGFAIPVRRVGDTECETLKNRLHTRVTRVSQKARVPVVEGLLGRSKLQELVVSSWHPTKVVVSGQQQPQEVVDDTESR